MCGRIVRERDDWGAFFGVVEESETRLPSRFNIAPTQLDLFIREQEDGRHVVASRWGLIPTWAKDRSRGGKMFNARAETLLERPAFRTLVARHRCIVPASGFYEWQATGRGKTPLYIHRADGAPLALAGLWSVWRDPERTADVASHTIITCAPNGFMTPIHNRMPVVLDQDAVEQWLAPDRREPAAVLPLLAPCADEVNAASSWDGGRYTPEPSRAWKNAA